MGVCEHELHGDEVAETVCGSCLEYERCGAQQVIALHKRERDQARADAKALRTAASKAANIVSDVAAAFGDEYPARIEQLAEAHAVLLRAVEGAK